MVTASAAIRIAVLLFATVTSAAHSRAEEVSAYPRVLPPEIAARLQDLPPSEHVTFLLAASEAAENQDTALSSALFLAARQMARDDAEQLLINQREQEHVMARGDYQTGLQLAESLLSQAQSLEDTQAQLDAYLALSRAHRLLGDYPAALRVLETGLDLTPELDDPARQRVRVLVNIASLDFALGNYADAAGRFEEAIAMMGDMPRDRFRAGVMGNYGLVLTELHRFDEAQAAHRQTRAIMREIEDLTGIADSTLNLADIERVRGNPAAAIPGIETALEVYEQLDAKGRQNTARLTLADLHQQLGHAETALRYLNEAVPTLEATQNRRHLVDFHRISSLVHEDLGNYPAALQSARDFAQLQNEIAGEEARRSIATLRAESELARKDAALAEAARDEARAQAALEHSAAQLAQTRTFFISATLIVAALGFAGVFTLQTRRRADRRILEESNRARQAAETANDLKTRLLTIASHDLKSPLRGVESVAADIQSRSTDPDLAEAAAAIRAQSGRMFALIRELIDLSALENGRLDISPEPVVILPCLRAARDRHTASASAKSLEIDLRANLADLDLTIDLDPERFDQVLDNLIDNAIKFSPLGQRILLDLSADDAWLRIAITDRGPGFSPQDYAKVFQPFQTLSAQSTGGESSSGLGLHIAHEIIGLHGGRLGIDSAPGQGATLVIELPISAPPPPANVAS